jgi:hypothetical protein
MLVFLIAVLEARLRLDTAPTAARLSQRPSHAIHAIAWTPAAKPLAARGAYCGQHRSIRRDGLLLLSRIRLMA